MSEQDKKQKDRELAQLLGLTIRGLLPMAQAEVDAWETAAECPATQMQADAANAMVKKGHEAIHRARSALDRLEKSGLSIRELPENHYDEAFEIKFEA